MKWLLLLMFVSCGKHIQPAALDMQDADGDQILNYDENGDEKFIANIEPMEKVTGNMKVILGTPMIISFSNSIDYTTKFLVGPEGSNIQADYFTEWSKLVFNKISSYELTESQYTLALQFSPMKTAPKQVSFVTPEKSWVLGPWSSSMKITLPREHLKSLLDGSAYLRLEQDFKTEEAIRQKTYRVYVFDGLQSKVFYVAKDWTVKEVMAFFNIDQYKQVQQEDLFFLESDSQVRWHVREFNNGDMVLSYTSSQSIRMNFLNLFSKSHHRIERINGLPVNGLNIAAKKNARVFFKIRGIRTQRFYGEYQYEKSFVILSDPAPPGHNNFNKCRFTARASTSEVTAPASVNDFLQNIPFPTDYLSSREDDYLIKEDADEQGMFFYLQMRLSNERLSLNLARLTDETFVQTGDLTVQCSRGKRDLVYTYENPEAKLSFEIESYVENNP